MSFFFVANEEVRFGWLFAKGLVLSCDGYFWPLRHSFLYGGNTHLNILRGRPGAATESDREKSAVSTPAGPSLAVQAGQEEHWADIEFDIRLGNQTSREVRF